MVVIILKVLMIMVVEMVVVAAIDGGSRASGKEGMGK